MLNKWTAMREGEQQQQGRDSGFLRRQNKRPHLASEVDSLPDAERYRGQIVAEIANLIGKIQNPALPEHELRELNDSINHKMREKFHWNRRVRELGGPDHNQVEKQRQVEQGDSQFAAVWAGGYRYFGAAKALPGVRELLEKQALQQQQKASAKSAGHLHKNVSVDYYGWRDEEDGVLLELEAEADAINQPVRKRPRPRRDQDDDDEEEEEGDRHEALVDEYLNMPSQDDIERRILEHKKKALLVKYGL
jgi:pre-mRNA-splicing factor ISY1